MYSADSDTDADFLTDIMSSRQEGRTIKRNHSALNICNGLSGIKTGFKRETNSKFESIIIVEGY